MEKNKKLGIKVFDIGDVPADFDPDQLLSEKQGEAWYADYRGYRIGIRRYVIIYVKNPMGEKFFCNPFGNRDADSLWDFVNMGFCMFPNYNSIPDAIKKNAVELSFDTKDFSVENDNSNFGLTTPADEEFYQRVSCDSRAGTLLFNARMKSHIEKRDNFTDEKNCDFILVKEEIFSEDECMDIADITPDAKIVGNICYCTWAGGRYFMRIRCLAARLSKRDEYLLNCHISDVFSDGWFYDGIFWTNP